MEDPNTAATRCFVPGLLSGQVALVTGGATGIGREISRVLGAAGAHVVLASRKEENLEATVAELRREGIEASHGVFDVRDPVGVRTVLEVVLEEQGRLDIVVNDAAGNFPAPMSSISPNGFKAIVDIDLLGTYNVSRTAFDVWLGDHGGSIVNISAPFELRGVSYQAHVAAAKAGVDSLTRTCAVEWGPYGIRVNAIAPGSIQATEGLRRFTESVPNASPHATRSAREARARDRYRQPGPVLCSPAARFISGQAIAVDGAGSVDMLRLGAGRI